MAGEYALRGPGRLYVNARCSSTPVEEDAMRVERKGLLHVEQQRRIPDPVAEFEGAGRCRELLPRITDKGFRQEHIQELRASRTHPAPQRSPAAGARSPAAAFSPARALPGSPAGPFFAPSPDLCLGNRPIIRVCAPAFDLRQNPRARTRSTFTSLLAVRI